MDSFRKLVSAGFLMLMLGFITLLIDSLTSVEAKVGGAFVIFIGPFPLAFGFGEYSPILILVSVAIAALMMLMILLMLMNLKRFQAGPDSP
ncbi:MAG: hypothetical protein QXU11_04385 [Thermoproteota archaeon]